MKRPTRPYQAILQRCARPYSSAPSPSPDSQPWPHLRRRARPSLLSQFDNTHDAQKSPESASSSSSPSSSSSKIGADSWLRELDRPETKRGWETKLRDRGAQHAFAENRNGSDESTGSRRAQAVRLDRQKGARGRQSETADPGPRNYEQDTFLQWLQDIAGPLEGGSGLDRDWGIRLRRDVVRPLPLKTRTATPELTRDEDQDHRLYGATSGTHSNTSTEDQGLSVTDLSKEIELRCYGARHLSNDDTKEDRAVFDRSVRREEPRGDHPGGDGGSELWLRHLARSDWGWERIDGTWTLRQTSDGTELVRTGMPAWTQERGVGVKENGLVAAEPPSVEIAAERRMITISGLSTNLTDRDFQRISPQPLSSWENTIKMGKHTPPSTPSCL